MTGDGQETNVFHRAGNVGGDFAFAGVATARKVADVDDGYDQTAHNVHQC